MVSSTSSHRLNKTSVLNDRAFMLSRARAFFATRNIIEVDCPILTIGASVDTHIDLMAAVYAECETRFLHSSPEYGMKRLLADGMGDIYQLSHVFRDGESSNKHNPEFMMAEWYRIGISFKEMIEETLEFVRIFLGTLPGKTITYREAFLQYAGFDYYTATVPFLMKYLEDRGIHLYSNIEQEGKDALLNIILSNFIEPHLGKDELCALAYYPASQAALAKTLLHGDELVAERFEVYYKGYELANGYHELTNAKEQHARFVEANVARRKLGKSELPIDEAFLAALAKGLPDSCGVAVGFDRLMMLRHQTSNIGDVIPFTWDEA